MNLGLAGVAVLFGCGALAALRVVADASGGVFALVIDALPVFSLALVGSLLVRLILEKSGQTQWVSTTIQSQTGTISADLLITAATACLDLSLLAHDWISLTVLALASLLARPVLNSKRRSTPASSNISSTAKPLALFSIRQLARG